MLRKRSQHMPQLRILTLMIGLCEGVRVLHTASPPLAHRYGCFVFLCMCSSDVNSPEISFPGLNCDFIFDQVYCSYMVRGTWTMKKENELALKIIISGLDVWLLVISSSFPGWGHAPQQCFCHFVNLKNLIFTHLIPFHVQDPTCLEGWNDLFTQDRQSLWLPSPLCAVYY